MVDGEYDDCDNGLWIQVKRDSNFRISETDCIKNSGGKKKDCYSLLLSDLSDRINSDEAQMEQVNTCIESASVFYMQKTDKDMTKCMSYAACNKNCDTNCDWPSIAPTQPPASSTMEPAVEPPNEDPIPQEDLPDYNDLDYEFSCGVDGDDTKCTISKLDAIQN